MTSLELYKSHDRLARYIAFVRSRSCSLDIEDLTQEARIGLWRACMNYNSEKGLFRHYASRCITNEINAAVAKEARYKTLFKPLSFQTPVDKNTLLEDTLIASEDAEELAAQREVIEKAKGNRFLWKWACGYSSHEQAKYESVSQPTVSSYIRKAKRSLLKELGG